MMFGSNNNILHSCVFCHLNPIISIVFYRIKPGRVFFIFLNFDISSFLYPFSVVFFIFILTSRNSVQTPMNKHSETCIAPPFHTGIFFRKGFNF